MTQMAAEYTLGEEITHSITHGIGALLSVAGLVVLVVHAALFGSAIHVVGCSVYGGTLLLLYTTSTLYHAFPPRLRRTKAVFQRLDHAAIYLLIAGTYTPFTLVALSGPWGVTLLALVWALAVVGLLLAVTPLRRYRRTALVLYLAMGWSCLIAAKPLIEALSWPALLLLSSGGVAYTAGVAFYVSDRKWSHSVWHAFVLTGSVLHFFAVLVVVSA